MSLNDDREAVQHSNDSPVLEETNSVAFLSPTIAPRPEQYWQAGADTGGTSDRKRSRRAMADDGALDDIMGQITSKLTTLSTNEFTEENSINAFVDVLNCSRTEAEFYLESSNWNVETAVMLWLENNPSSYSSTTHMFGGNTYADTPFHPIMMPGASTAFQRPRSQPKYRARTVVIQDLPSEWTARVSKHTGYVYFVHNVTGVTQYCVPTGYADLSGTGSSPNNALDLSGDRAPNNTDEDNDMEDDSRDSSMEAVGIEPVSPGADPFTHNTQSQPSSAYRLQQSGQKSTTSSSSSNTHNTHHSTHNNESSAFRDAMDAYHSDHSVHSAHSTHTGSSSKPLWDEGSGYSLNDPAYSASSTTTNYSSADETTVFGHMASNNPLPSFTSTNANVSNPTLFAHSVHPGSITSTGSNQSYTVNNNFAAYPIQNQVATETHSQYNGSTAGIAMQSTQTSINSNNSDLNDIAGNSPNNG